MAKSPRVPSAAGAGARTRTRTHARSCDTCSEGRTHADARAKNACAELPASFRHPFACSGQFPCPCRSPPPDPHVAALARLSPKIRERHVDVGTCAFAALAPFRRLALLSSSLVGMCGLLRAIAERRGRVRGLTLLSLIDWGREPLRVGLQYVINVYIEAWP
jgi:hypothetical protein